MTPALPRSTFAVTRALVAPSQRRLLLLEPILRAEGTFHPSSHHVLERRHRQRRAGTTDSDDRRFPHERDRLTERGVVGVPASAADARGEARGDGDDRSYAAERGLCAVARGDSHPPRPRRRRRRLGRAAFW